MKFYRDKTNNIYDYKIWKNKLTVIYQFVKLQTFL